MRDGTEDADGRRPLLPLAVAATPAGGELPHLRADAARNREALVVAARELVASCGAAAVTMEAVAARAGVGKGTVFRRFESRQGLMRTVLDASEADWQASVISGPPPLGPGGDPYARLVAFGRSRLEMTLQHAELLEAAGFVGEGSLAARSFAAMHVRMLLGECGVRGDLPLLATALLAPLDVPVLRQQVWVDGYSLDRIHAGWVDLLDRVLRR